MNKKLPEESEDQTNPLTNWNLKKQTVATQTDEETNKGQGRAALRPNPSDPNYPLSNSKDIPQCKKIICQVFGEEFLAVAMQKDCQMVPIMKPNRERDWETLKRVSPYF